MAKTVVLGGKKLAELTGLNEVTAQLNSMVHMLESKDIADALLGAAWVIRDEAKRLVPVDTGLLRDNIYATYEKNGKGKLAVKVGVRYGPKGAPHAHLIEFGSQHNEAQPFLRPAVVAKRQEVFENFVKNARELIATTLAKNS